MNPRRGHVRYARRIPSHLVAMMDDYLNTVWIRDVSPAISIGSIPNVCGIYQIINTATDERYVGGSLNMLSRVLRHASMLKKGIHPNGKMLNAYCLNSGSFMAEVVEECSPHRLMQAETYWIDRLGSAGAGYNIQQKSSITPIASLS